jgi:8-oxo-dGTP pyrophosphatase MutT (NUDIX family)
MINIQVKVIYRKKLKGKNITKDNMKSEIAAGGLIVRKNHDKWKLLFVRDPYGQWTFPKGHSEKIDTTLLNTAIREIREEVGLTKIELIREIIQVNYKFTLNKIEINKTVTFFLFKLTQSEPIVCQTTEGISDYKWVDLNTAISFTGYPNTNIPIIQKALQILTNS